MIIGYTGLPRSGKGISLIKKLYKVVKRNKRWKKLYGFERPIYLNFYINEKLFDYPIQYFNDAKNLYTLEGADVFIDEAYKYWNSRYWDKLPEQAIAWFAEQDKIGCDIYFATQEFVMLDIMFRRVTEEIYYVKRLFGSRRPGKNKPPVKNAWGLISQRKINAVEYDEQNKTAELSFLGLPNFTIISNKYAHAYDTNERIKNNELLQGKQKVVI